MPADVRTRQLRYFLAVAESGSFRHAARQLYVTQPALSRSIKQLEASLGVRLFERSTRGTELTGMGFAIAEPAKRLPESLDRACAQLWPAQNYVCHEMPQDEVAASGLAARTGCGEVPEVWRDRTAPPRSRSPCWTAPRPATAAGPDGWPGNCRRVRDQPHAVLVGRR